MAESEAELMRIKADLPEADNPPLKSEDDGMSIAMGGLTVKDSSSVSPGLMSSHPIVTSKPTVNEVLRHKLLFRISVTIGFHDEEHDDDNKLYMCKLKLKMDPPPSYVTQWTTTPGQQHGPKKWNMTVINTSWTTPGLSCKVTWMTRIYLCLIPTCRI